MAKQRTSDDSESGISLLEARAWEIFARRVPVGATLTVTNEGLAEDCFKAAAVFKAVAEQHKTKG